MGAQTLSTKPAGCCFVSYRRTRRAEISRLVHCLNERGVPTWQDLENLDETHTNAELRRVLHDPKTASAVLWLTPDVAESDIIRRIEAPLIMTRADSEEDHFFVVPVAAGGVDYGRSASVVGEDYALSSIEEWNLLKIANNPAKDADIRRVANRVLSRRLRAIVQLLDDKEPIRIGLFSRVHPPTDNSLSLALDWTDCFRKRHASENTWEHRLLPSIEDIVTVVGESGGGRSVLASGFPTISAVFALGRGFMVPSAIDAAWEQTNPEGASVKWSVRQPGARFDLKIKSRDKDAGANDLAVLVSISAPVEHAWAASRSILPPFRALVDIRPKSEGRIKLSAGQARNIAHEIIDGIREARSKFRPKGIIHLFMAVPAGLGFMLGQLSNTLGPIRLYEHDEVDAVGRYIAGPTLEP